MVELTASKLAPAAERRSGRIIRDGLLFASAALMALTLYLVFMWVPTDANMGVSQRILYFHVPVSVLGLLSIVVVAVASGASPAPTWGYRRCLAGRVPLTPTCSRCR